MLARSVLDRIRQREGICTTSYDGSGSCERWRMNWGERRRCFCGPTNAIAPEGGNGRKGWGSQNRGGALSEETVSTEDGYQEATQGVQ